MGLGTGSLADVVDLAIVAVEHDGDALLASELVARLSQLRWMPWALSCRRRVWTRW